MATILIVDDSRFMRLALKAIFKAAGYDVVGEAGNGKEAIKLYRELTPNVITLDIMMESMDGLSALKVLMEEVPKPIVVIISAHKNTAMIEDAKAMGAAGFIKKPFNPQEITRIIKEVCAQRA
ncbi:MAG: response regulator [Elusimicrobiota bacterium]